MLNQYRETITQIVAMILRETKEPNIESVPMEFVREYYTPDPDEQVQIDDLLEYIATGTQSAIEVKYGGGDARVIVRDKVALYLMLYSLNFNMATVDLLHWKDFEQLVKYALEENGFKAVNNFHFKDAAGKKYEIDTIAADKFSKEHIIILIDAKHWDHRTNSSPQRVIDAADEQYKRALALGKTKHILSELLLDLKLKWHDCILMPMVVTLLAPPVQNFSIPIVSILNFNNFILEFSNNMDFFKKVYVKNIPEQKTLD